MTARYHMTLNESKRLNAPLLIERAKANNINADGILYNYAIGMVCISRGKCVLNIIYFNYLLFFSARWLLLMNYLVLLNHVLVVISQLKFYCIHWLHELEMTEIKHC